MGNKRVIRALAVLVFIAGCLILLFPRIHGWTAEYLMRRETEEFLLMLEESDKASDKSDTPPILQEVSQETARPYHQLWEDMCAYNASLYETSQSGLSNPSAYEQPSFTLSDYGLASEVFGVIAIPKLDVELPLYLGATKQHMADGAAHMSQTSLPIGGSNTNCVIAGHRGWNGTAYFLYLPQLEPGGLVTVTTLWETLTYQVVEETVISPNDVDAIRIQPGRELLTLLTCHPPASGGKQRYLVICERVQNEMEENA